MMNSRTFCFKTLLRTIICFGGGSRLKAESMMTSLRDQVMDKTLSKTAASMVKHFHSINICSIKVIALWYINNTDFSHFSSI